MTIFCLHLCERALACHSHETYSVLILIGTSVGTGSDPVVTLFFSPTAQVFGVHGVWAAGGMDQYGLDLRHPHPVPLHPALQHLPREAPLALLRHRPGHPCDLQV